MLLLFEEERLQMVSRGVSVSSGGRQRIRCQSWVLSLKALEEWQRQQLAALQACSLDLTLGEQRYHWAQQRSYCSWEVELGTDLKTPVASLVGVFLALPPPLGDRRAIDTPL